ncbi:fungal-specific transcription factor domain-containing protein [Podospora fimiseda]|uniref:Fungal-specific transcription factor domain-containing protein n=1 Tax=Podospora fimiseda TaxID=252190 RepID=A0AAN6YMM4_9PEZI|nr:fungal-specific transcription factor domain-containing protein [Podospora fimiseda]
MSNTSSESNASSPDAILQSQPLRQTATRVDRPCDTCRKRKSKCAKEPGQERCVLCAFHNRDCTYLNIPQPRGKRRTVESSTDKFDSEIGKSRKKPKASKPDTSPATEPYPDQAPPSLLDRTLGLHRTTHFRYIGSSSPHEEKLLDIIHQSQDHGAREECFKFRLVADSTTFLSKSDHQTPLSADIDHDLEAVEQLVQPHGLGLVELYFRTVHPSYPILHKAVFLEKYARSYSEFSPALLAAVYLLAMDWWEFDRHLSSHQKPDADSLSRLAMKALMDVIHRPKLSSVQAGLLLLQRAGGDSWVLTSQVLAIGEELGLNLDCTDWNIPDWEKGLRRRLAWAVLMQDKWSSLIHGRPSHIVNSYWQIPPVTLIDFPESAADDDDKEGSTEVEQGRLLFIHLTRLTHIMRLALETLYSPAQAPVVQNLVATKGVQGLLELVKPLAVQLKDWAHSLPPELHMSSSLKTGKLCSNGYLHLSYFVTEIIIHRHIIRALSESTAPSILQLCRDAGRARLERAIAFVDALRPEHLQAFWWFAAPKSLAYIRTYGGLLWATSRDEDEREFYRKRLGEFRWGLKVRSKGVGFVGVALKEMEESLREIDMTSRPVPSLGCRDEVFEAHGYIGFPGLDQGFHYFHQQSAEMDDPSTFSLGGEFVTLDDAHTFERGLYGA